MSFVAIGDWPRSVWFDFASLMCGEYVGSGVDRDVYVLATDPTKVVKIEQSAGTFQNALEWETWNALRDTKYAKYFAPCRFISQCGNVLIMDRAEPLKSEHERIRLPDFLTDFKRSNYGVLDGRVVCCDYGTNLLLNHGAFASKMRRPEWW